MYVFFSCLISNEILINPFDGTSTQVHKKIQTEDHDQLTTIINNKIIVLAWEMGLD